MELSLGGLWCASCAWLIGETLQRTHGVQSAEVSFARREARVTYDPSQVDPRRLARRIRRLGYRAWPAGERADYDEEERHADLLLITGVIAAHDLIISLFLYIWQYVAGAPQDTAWLATFFHSVLLVGGIPMILLLGLPILRAGIASLLTGRPNMHALIALGAFSAFALSVRNFLLGHGHLYFDTASMLLYLVAVGRWLEIRAQKQSNEAVERLLKQLPDEATWLTPEGEQRVPVERLPAGARILVRPGERFPVDGLIAVGEGDVDESLLTGEPIPVMRRPGEQVLAGTINVDGGFEIITTAVGASTAAGQIGRLLHQALWERTPIQQLADRLAGWMVPIAVLIAAGTFTFWAAQSGVETGLMNALSVLLIACPCALGLATPLTLWLGIGRAAEGGAILRSSSALERLAQVRRVYFDKTGTLTQREFRVQYILSPGMDTDVFLAFVAAAEVRSEHPFGKAVVEAAQRRGLALADAEGFHAIPGHGVSARLGELLVMVGSGRLMADRGLVTMPALANAAMDWQAEGLSVIYAGWDGQVRGLLGLGEEARPMADGAVADLRRLGLDVSVLTGDDAAAGERWAQRLNVPVYAELLPEDKIRHLKESSRPVAMVGDGINDGPALAAAHVGIALSHGTDVARAAADAVLLGDDLRAVPWLIRLSRAAMHRVRQNLAWAFVYNLIGLGLAATGHLWPVLSALAMVLSSVFVTGNALRLRRFPLFSENGSSPS